MCVIQPSAAVMVQLNVNKMSVDKEYLAQLAQNKFGNLERIICSTISIIKNIVLLQFKVNIIQI